MKNQTLIVEIVCVAHQYSVFSLSLPIFGGFYFVRIGKLKMKSILVLAIFFLRVMCGNVVFCWYFVYHFYEV